MPIFGLSDKLIFPPPDLTDDSGIIAVGGDLSPKRVLLAYSQGIFPWPHEGYPLLWFCPLNRFVLLPREIHLGRSLQKTMRKNIYIVKFDTRFADVMKACQSSFRPGQDRTWITDEMIDGYTKLHDQGFAHSVEVYHQDELVGGLYGISLGTTFFGESMFTKKPEASKVGFATLVSHVLDWNFDLIDCQTETQYLASFGARSIPRLNFLASLAGSLKKPTRRAKWICAESTSESLAKMHSLLAGEQISH